MIKKTSVDLNSKITWSLSIIAIIISIISIILSAQPADTKLTIKSSMLKNSCFNTKEGCYELFIYNNDKAPCFDFKFEYDNNDFNRVVLLKDYELSNIFNATFDGKTISFPAMPTIPIIDKWLGYLDKDKIAYFAFFPKENLNKQKKITISCVDYKQEILFK